jgi:hypothetical protein
MQGYSQGDAVASVEHRTLIAGCFSDVKGGPEIAEANARLIAAAPELLDECISALAAIEDDTRSPRRIEAVKAGLRAAIAKATGK